MKISTHNYEQDQTRQYRADTKQGKRIMAKRADRHAKYVRTLTTSTNQQLKTR